MTIVMPRADLMKRVSMIVPPMHAMRHRILAATVLLALAVAALRCGATSRAASPDGVARAVFTTSGEARLPLGYGQWEHVGTRDNAAGKLSILDGMPTTTPEVLFSDRLHRVGTAMIVYEPPARHVPMATTNFPHPRSP